MKKRILAALFVVALLVANTTSALAYSGYAYSIGGEFHNGDDVRLMADYWAVCGYSSYYSDDPTYEYVDDANRLNSDVLYFSSHGDWDRLFLLNGVELTNGYSDSSANEVGILDYSLTNNRVVIYDACLTASGSDNLCTATYDQGADAVIGWPVVVYASDSYSWMDRFADYASRGYTLNESMDHADSYTDYADNSGIKSHKLYGDGEQDIQTNWRSNEVAVEENSREISLQNTPTILSEIPAAIHNSNPDFDTSNCTVFTTENESRDLITVDYVEMRDDFITNSGYTAIIKDGVVDKIFDNTLTTQTDIEPIAVTEEDYNNAEAAARAEIEGQGNRVKQLTTEKFLDMTTGQYSLRTKVAYYYQDTTGVGGTVFYYNLNH